MYPGQIVTCELAFNNFQLLNNNGPTLGEVLTITSVQQIGGGEFISFLEYDRDNMELFFNSIYFAE